MYEVYTSVFDAKALKININKKDFKIDLKK